MSTSKSPSEIMEQPGSELEPSRETTRTTGVVPTAAELAASGALDSLFEQIDAGKLQLSGNGGLIC